MTHVRTSLLAGFLVGSLLVLGCSGPSYEESTEGDAESSSVEVTEGSSSTTTPTYQTPEQVAAAAPAGPVDDHTVALGAHLKMPAPKAWKRVPPTSSMVSYEFAIPAAEGDANDGRMTMMQAGGSVDANITRWKGQFSQPDGGNTEDFTEVEKLTVAGQEVHLVDISGTFNIASMMAPPNMQDGYRMLAAIVVADSAQFFIKFYGPEKTVEAHASAFRAMIEGIE